MAVLAEELMNFKNQDVVKRQRHAQAEAIIDEHGRGQAVLIAILQDIQEKYRYLPEDLLNHVAMVMKLSPATVYGVATFYAQFSLEPKGKYVIKICDGTACHVRGSDPVQEAIRKRYGLKSSQKTTADLRYTVETVSCLGACGLAPVMMINDRIYGQMTPEAVQIILDRLEQEPEEGDDCD
jgi:NADH-quinone oxidoreductase subunit E